MDEAEEMQVDKLSYEIFSNLKSKFLFECAAPGKAAQRGKVCVLCVNSGGLRALWTGRALAHPEPTPCLALGDPDALIIDYFDLAAMLFPTHSRGAPLVHANNTWWLVADHAPRMFRRLAGSSASLF